MDNPDLVLQETGSRPTYSRLNYVPSGDTLRRDTISSLNWVTKFDLLGITFHLDLNKMLNLNYEKGISDIEKILNVYRKFKLSLLGKVNVIKTMAIPKLVYFFSVLPSPPTVIVDRIENIFRDFLWDGTTVQISNKQLE